MLNTYIARQIYAKISFDATVSQKKVVEKLSEHLTSPDYERIFILNGYAGTGKTTLISALVEVLDDMGIKSILLAPTGRAAKVLTHYSGKTALTIHKRIYRQRTNASYESKFKYADKLKLFCKTQAFFVHFDFVYYYIRNRLLSVWHQCTIKISN